MEKKFVFTAFHNVINDRLHWFPDDVMFGERVDAYREAGLNEEEMLERLYKFYKVE